jgi:TetR/AcrR family transcriptional regulator, cholesterol catabolism regulator
MARKPANQSVSRDDIIMAAADVLQRNGYEATTMKDIAAQVKLTAASLYHHFRNKDALLLAVLEGGLNHVIEQMEAVLHSDAPHSDKLRRMIAIHVVNLTHNTAVGAAMVFEIRPLMTMQNGTDEQADLIARRDTFFQRRKYFEGLFRQVVQGGITAGEFRAVDVPLFSKTLLGAHNWVGVWYRDGGRLTGQQIAAQIADTFLAALAR